MRNTDCIFTWKNIKSGKFEYCSAKTKYSGDVYGKVDEKGARPMPMIDFEFCEDHYEEGLNNPEYIFKNVKKL